MQQSDEEGDSDYVPQLDEKDTDSSSDIESGGKKRAHLDEKAQENGADEDPEERKARLQR